MNRAWIVLGLGLAAASLAYIFVFLGLAVALHSRSADQPAELDWLRREFHLSSQEYASVARLHATYLSQCALNCEKIREANRRLKSLLAETNQMTSAIEEALVAAARTRVECQVMMLSHFYEVGRAMPAAQGKRYLERMQAETLLPTYRTHRQTERLKGSVSVQGSTSH